MPSTTRRVLGVDLGGSSIKWTVLCGPVTSPDIVANGRVDTPKQGTAAVLDRILEIAASAGSVEVVGIGVPGLHEPDGSTMFIPNVPGDWRGFRLGSEVSQRLGMPVNLINDSRAFTLAEWRRGAGGGCRHLVAVTVGTGVGGGVVSEGRLHLGHLQRAGEIGHQCVDPSGPRCGCGSRGCVETYASGPAIVAAATRAVLQGVGSALRDTCGGVPAELSVEAVAECARAGDAFAADVFDRAGRAIGHGLANVCTVLAPERVVIGGGVVEALDLMRPAIDEAIRSMAPLPEPPSIAPAELGNRAGAIGAAIWSAEREEEQA